MRSYLINLWFSVRAVIFYCTDTLLRRGCYSQGRAVSNYDWVYSRGQHFYLRRGASLCSDSIAVVTPRLQNSDVLCHELGFLDAYSMDYTYGISSGFNDIDFLSLFKNSHHLSRVLLTQHVSIPVQLGYDKIFVHCVAREAYMHYLEPSALRVRDVSFNSMLSSRASYSHKNVNDLLLCLASYSKIELNEDQDATYSGVTVVVNA